MKLYFTVLLSLLSLTSWSQNKDTTAKNIRLIHPTYLLRSVTATMSLGFMDENRQNYSVPSGFSKGVVSGFTPFFAKLEYGLTDNVSIGATFSYDAFIYNIQQDYTGNNGPFTRYFTDNARIISGGLAAFYHFGKKVHIRRLDPFLGAGIELNNIRYHAYPQGDSTVIKFDHTLTLYLKAGARYYISDRFSLFGDLGYERQSYLTIGCSCRFFNKNHM